MYVPKSNLMTADTEIVEFIKRFSFATIITASNNLPLATHLPFLIDIKEGQLLLTSHFAYANDHWKELTENKVLVIFNEPNAYISPTHYEKELNVPTWNYMAVHAYGEGKLITESAKVAEVLEQTIDFYEHAYKQQWDHLPVDYKEGLMKGIVAFEIVVTALQGKKKTQPE
jgi:transcriptional regulator